MTQAVAERNEGLTMTHTFGPYLLVRPAGSEYGFVTYADSKDDDDAFEALIAAHPGGEFIADFPYELDEPNEVVHNELWVFPEG